MTTPPCQVFIDAFHNGVDVSMTFKFLSMIYGDKFSTCRTIQRVRSEMMVMARTRQRCSRDTSIGRLRPRSSLMALWTVPMDMPVVSQMSCRVTRLSSS